MKKVAAIAGQRSFCQAVLQPQAIAKEINPGAIGLIVPPLVHILPVLTPLAALGLAVVMVGAIVVHGRRKEYPNVAVNVVLLGLALFVAWGRFGAYAF